MGHELAEQTRTNVPDGPVFSMGDGWTISGGWTGFREFAALGYVAGTQKMFGVQAEEGDVTEVAPDIEAVVERY